MQHEIHTSNLMRGVWNQGCGSKTALGIQLLAALEWDFGLVGTTL